MWAYARLPILAPMSRKAESSVDESTAPLPKVVTFENVVLGTAEHPGAAPLSFTVEQGGLCLLAGPARAGKSEALARIALECGGGGRVLLFGRDTSRLKAREVPLLRRRIGRIFQDLRLDDDLNAFDNVALAVRAIGRPAQDSRHQIAEVLAWLGLAAQMGKRPKRLSNLDRRRLAVARAVINRPTLILADEPTGELTGKAAAALLRPLIDMHHVGTTVLIASRRADLLVDAGATVIALAPSPAPDVAAGAAA